MARARIAVYLGLYLALILFARLHDRLILFPSAAPIDAGNAVRKAIPFQKGELEIWTAKSALAHQKGPDVFVLRFYGNADRADRWVAAEAEMWNDRAVEIWGINYPGYGGSSGPARLDRIGPAALAAFDALKEVAAQRPIVPFGASLGATAALHIGAQRQTGGLILHNPPAIRQMVLRQFGWWNLWLLAGPVAFQLPKDLDSVANSQASKAPAIFLLAENDEIVAPRFQKLVADAYGGEKRIINLRGATHNSPIDETGLADLYNALDWLLPRSKEN